MDSLYSTKVDGYNGGWNSRAARTSIISDVAEVAKS